MQTTATNITAADNPYAILILGDGNFSFSLACAQMIAKKDPFIMQYLGLPHWNVSLECTSFDSLEALYVFYDDFKVIREKLLRFPFVNLKHQVNAWETTGDYSLVIWNHPHIGTENFKLHRFLISHFFDCSKQICPRILISLVQGQETRWDVVDRAQKVGFFLVGVQLFQESDFPGYLAKRNSRGESFKNIHTKRHVGTVMKSHRLEFSTKPPEIDLEMAGLFSKLVIPTMDPQEMSLPIPCKASRSDSTIKGLVCPHCKKQLSSERAYKSHVHMVHELKLFGEWQPDRPRVVGCTVCDKKFPDIEAQFQHMTNKHSSITSTDTCSKQKNYEMYDYEPCNVCGQAVAKQPLGMKQHHQQMKPALGLANECHLCNSKFMEERALLQHFKFCRLKTTLEQ